MCSTWTRSSGQRNIVYFQGNAYAVWERDQEIYFSETQTGTSGLWTEPVTVTGSKDESHAAIAVGPDGRLFVVIQQCINCGGSGSSSRILLLVRKTDQDPFVRLPLGDANGETGPSSQNPALAVSPDGATVYVVWSAVVGNNQEDILFQRVNPAGTGSLIDLKPKPVLESPLPEFQPAIGVAENDHVFVAWVQAVSSRDDVWATVSTDGGTAFLSPAAPVSESTGFDQKPSVVAGLPGTVHIAWEKDTCEDGCYHVAVDKGVLGTNGLTFGADEFVQSFFNPPDPDRRFYSQHNPSIAWDGANGVYIALSEVVSGQSGIFLTKSTNNGQTFGPLQSIDNDAKTAEKDYASIAVDESGRAFAVWTDARGGTSGNYVWFAQGE